MKLRFRENSIRLRLLQSEVKNLKESGSVSEKITFGNSQNLIYRLQISNQADAISADFESDEIVVRIPSETARDWIDTEKVGLEIEQETGNGKPLKILIEKDFVCVERPADADNADAFPHPKMKC